MVVLAAIVIGFVVWRRSVWGLLGGIVLGAFVVFMLLPGTFPQPTTAVVTSKTLAAYENGSFVKFRDNVKTPSQYYYRLQGEKDERNLQANRSVTFSFSSEKNLIPSLIRTENIVRNWTTWLWQIPEEKVLFTFSIPENSVDISGIVPEK